MKKSLFVVLVGCMALFAGCNLVVPTSKYETLETENADQLVRLEQLEIQVNDLQEQNTILEEKLSERRQQEVIDPFDEKILGSLFLRPDLIPVGDENMRYYTDLCRVLGEKYVYAYAEDGRNTADMILSYDIQEDGAYDWKMEAFDVGKGWEVPGGAETDTAGIVPPPEAGTVQPPTESQSPAPENASSVPEKTQSTHTPGLNVPVPNEAQQQKFREIASLIE